MCINAALKSGAFAINTIKQIKDLMHGWHYEPQAGNPNLPWELSSRDKH